MAWYVVSYDLRKQRNYQPLYDRLGEWKAVRLLESVWLADVNGTATSVRDSLRALIDGDDGIVVLELKSGFQWATAGVQPTGVAWLRAKSP